MEPANLDTAGLAQALGVEPGEIVHLVADQEPLTSHLALRLARCFKTTPQFWLGLQTAYDLSVAHEKFGAEIEARVRPVSA
jgi:addiction module HigA family antidote